MNERACSQCRFSCVERPNPQVLQSVRFCRRRPPTPILIPVAPTQAQMQAVWPVVADAHWCYDFELIDSIGN